MPNLGEQIQSFEDNYFDLLTDVEKKYIEGVLKYVSDNYVQAGMIKPVENVSTTIVGFSNTSKELLFNAGYLNATDDFLGRFSFVEQETIRTLQAELKLTQSAIQEIFDQSATRRYFLDQTKQRLLRTGIGAEYLEGVKNTIINYITRGAPFSDLEKELRAYYIDKGLLTSRVRTMASDALSFYNGQLNDMVAIELDIKHYKYVGGLITTTRPFCEHMSGLGIITDKDIQEALDEYCPDGVPSQSTVKNLRGKRVAKGSGMINGTTLSNFSIYRGGYGCRHERLPVAVTEAEKARIEQRNAV